ncbi:zinc metalloproteinase nas-4-like [Rhopilema esculentum]|uniref:zinc metalloproteinase nas-4-like n=1 Tax=Rhopilema esculentum TaxID=499914 RepID=UPI0031E296EB
MELKLFLILCILGSAINYLHGKPSIEAEFAEDDSDMEYDSKNGESITEKIIKLNEKKKAKCLIDGDVRDENCKGGAEKRNAARDRNKLWHTRQIPYVLDSSLNNRKRAAIRNAIRDYHRYTCIRFTRVSPASKEHYIRFFSGRGCWSYVGKTSAKHQDISIGRGCGIKGIVIHELMHALGFWHEQSRYDRDSYVRIVWSNIPTNRRHNFNKKSIQEVTSLGLPYDYDGVMHYGAKAFAIDRRFPTIVKLRNTGGQIGQRRGFSLTDIAQLNTLYDCESPCGSTWSQWSRWSHCITMSGRRRERRQRFCIDEDLSRCRGNGGRRVQKRERACGSGRTQVTRAVVCEGKNRLIACPSGHKLHILSANYGRTNRYVCNGPGRPIRTTGCYARNSLNVVRNSFRCQNRRSCRLYALNRRFGDPCRGTFKYLDVKYRCYRSRG